MKALLSRFVFSALVSTSCLAATPQYKARTDIATGFKYLYGMAVADFNGDGKPDIAATDNNSKTLYVYLNDGSGAFGAPKTIPLIMGALGPGVILTGDFNEDGKQDLIVGTVAGAQSNLLLIGNGDGTFTQGQDLPGSFGFWSGAVTDINRDKHLDLILGMNGTFFIYVGDGHGNFLQQAMQVQPSGAFLGVAAADFNKDGNTDFAIASPIQTAGVRYYSGNGNGTFSSANLLTFPSIYQPSFLAASDFDGDGNQDLLIGVPFLAVIEPGNGDGTFNSSKAVSPNTPLGPGSTNSYAASVAAADVDGDSKTDVVVAEDDSKTINLFLNDGTGKFLQSKPDFSAAIDHGVVKLAVTDLNGDGILDFALANNVTQNISVFLSIKPKAAATVSLTSSANPQLVGSSITITAKVTGTGSNIPTGTATLFDGTTSVGQLTLDGNAQTTFPLSLLSVGQHSLTIAYSGDNNFLPATSSVLTQSIADFQIALPTTSQTVTAGGATTYSLTVTPAGGLTGSISISCSQLPSLASCDPVTVPVNGQPATATLTVHTTAPITSRNKSTIHTASFGLLAIAFTALLPLRRRRPIQLLAVTVALVLVGSSVGCSGGSTKSTTTPGTPQGTAQFTVNSSVTLGGQTLTRSTTATLVVQ